MLPTLPQSIRLKFCKTWIVAVVESRKITLIRKGRAESQISREARNADPVRASAWSGARFFLAQLADLRA